MFHLGADTEARRVLRSRLYLIGLALAFFGPLLAATLVFQNAELRTQLRGESHGTLIAPPIQLPRAWFEDAQAVRGRWTLLYDAPVRCDLHCEANLFLLRQVSVSLGSLRPRTQVRVLLATDTHRAVLQPLLRGMSPDVLRMRPATFPPEVFATFPPGSVYLVDPLGNLLMFYDETATARGMLGDIRRLLKASRIG